MHVYLRLTGPHFLYSLYMTALLLSLLLSLPIAPAASGRPLQPEPGYARSDTSSHVRTPIDARPKLFLTPIWSRTTGFGIGGGLEVDHLIRAGTRLRVVARPGQHVGRYGVTFYTSDPHRARLYGIVNGYYETTGRQWYYGLGPASDASTRFTVERSRVEAELRAGATWLDGRLFVQPLLRLTQHRVEGFRPWKDASLDALREQSRTNLLFTTGGSDLTGEGTVFSGVWYGLSAGFDTRTELNRPERGLLVQATAERYAPTGGPEVRLDRIGGAAYVFVPTGRFIPIGPGGQVLAFRLLVEHARARGQQPVPFFFLPSLGAAEIAGFGRDRFFGNDLLALGLEYHILLFDAFGIAGIEGLFSLHAGNVYDDLTEQFTPRLTFEKHLEAGAGTVPLRPALGVGMRVVSLFDDRVYMQATVGLTPEGFGYAGFSFVSDLRALAWYKQ